MPLIPMILMRISYQTGDDDHDYDDDDHDDDHDDGDEDD